MARVAPGLGRPMIETRIEAALEACVAAGAPGAIVAVEAPVLGVSFAGAAGRFARGEPRPLAPEDPFRAASVTKAVTAAAAVRLAVEGRWSLDDPAARYLAPEVVAMLRGLEGLDDVGALTLRRLLGHTAGVPDYYWPAHWTGGGAAIAGTVNLAGLDRVPLLDAVVCALDSARTSTPPAAP